MSTDECDGLLASSVNLPFDKNNFDSGIVL